VETGGSGQQVSEPPAGLVELGVVRGAYGVRGWVHVAPYAPDADVLRAARRWWLVGVQPPREVEVLGVRRQGSGLVAKWRGCEDPETAERMRGVQVAVARGDFPSLPQGQYYWVDLIGLRVWNRSGRDLGRVKGLRASAAHDLLEIQADGGHGEILVPMIDRFVDSVDCDGGGIQVDWDPEWLN
jgi:16S rRNA processing protein RimM